MSNSFSFIKQSFFSLNESFSTIETDIEAYTVGEYTLYETIGQGASAVVRRATKGTSNQQYAIKIFQKAELKRKKGFMRPKLFASPQKTAFEKLQKEISMISQLDHPNIIKFHEMIDEPDSDQIYLVMEYAPRGQLLVWDEDNKTFSNPNCTTYLSEDLLRIIFNGIIEGVDYLHSQGIIHRDLKPQNILQDKYRNPKIADFGCAIHIEDPSQDTLKNMEGTHFFMAPEVVGKNVPESGYSGKAADVWAMGVTFFALTFHCLPFYQDNLLDLFEVIEKKPLEFPKVRRISNDLKKFLRCLLEKDPKRRMTIEQLKSDDWLLEPFGEAQLNEVTNKQQINQAYEKLRKCTTMSHEKAFRRSGSLLVKDGNQLRRSETSEVDFLSEPRKKVHLNNGEEFPGTFPESIV